MIATAVNLRRSTCHLALLLLIAPRAIAAMSDQTTAPPEAARGRDVAGRAGIVRIALEEG